MVSLKRLHTIAARISITPEHDVAITFQSGITFVIDATHRFYIDEEKVQTKSDINILRRRMFSKFTLDVRPTDANSMELLQTIRNTKHTPILVLTDPLDSEDSVTLFHIT